MPRSRFRRAQRLVREVHRMGADLRILLFMLPCVPSSAMGQTAQHAESAERIVRLGGVVICNDREATAHVGIGRGWTGGEAGLALLKSLDNLTTLDLSGCKLTDAGLEHVGSVPTPKRLELRDTPITDAGLAHLSDMANLTYLDLSATAVTDRGLLHLRNLTNLRYLRVADTSVTDDGISALSLPHLVTMYLYDREKLDDGGPKWYTMRQWRHVLVGNPPVVDISSRRARELFNRSHPYLRAYDASRFTVDPETLNAQRAETQKLSRARLKSLSVDHLIVEVIHLIDDSRAHKKGAVIWRCDARYRIPRDAMSDALFAARRFEAKFGYTFHGVAYGMRKDDVVRTLGEPEYEHQHQLASWVSWYYTEPGLLVFFDAGRVYNLRRSDPPYWAKPATEPEDVQ